MFLNNLLLTLFLIIFTIIIIIYIWWSILRAYTGSLFSN